jgi:hypothetical protein
MNQLLFTGIPLLGIACGIGWAVVSYFDNALGNEAGEISRSDFFGVISGLIAAAFSIIALVISAILS